MKYQALLGAIIGDATGATLEGYNTVTLEQVEHALTLPGGGPLRVGPGQITDDGELTLSLWRALQDCDPRHGFPDQPIRINYIQWYHSIPFDIGYTCSQAFDILSEYPNLPFDDLKQHIYRTNHSSQANGALMRATAIATWIAPYDTISAEQGAEYAMEDAFLSHPHPICQDTNAIYVYALIHLLRGLSPSQTLEYTNEFVIMNDFSPEVKHWYFTESMDISDIDCTKQIGHVRWGFVMAFYFLRHSSIPYEEALRQTLIKGGDTDTNACIVGGMVGTYQEPPSSLVQAVMQLDCTKQSHRRPPEYSVFRVLDVFKFVSE